MNRLLLETATDICSVAVARGETIVAERTAAEAFRHSTHLTLFIAEVLGKAGLRPAELQEIVLSDGPGSYTSLRVGAATAKGLCVALPELPLRVVGSLTALALSGGHEGPVLATLNSRRGEVFGQFFPGEAGLAEERSVSQPHNLQLTAEAWWVPYLRAGDAVTVIGPGKDRVREYLPETIGEFRFAGPGHCSASLLLAPALSPTWSRQVDVAAYEPFYLNPPFVTKSKKKPLG